MHGRKLPLWLSGKGSTCNGGDARDTGSVPGLGRSPEVGNGNPLQYSCLENCMYRGTWWATSMGSQRVGQDWTHTHTHTHTHSHVGNRSSTHDKGHEEGGSAYAKAGSSLRSPPGNSRASTPKTRVCLLSALCSHLHLWLYGGGGVLSPTTSLWKKS